MPRSATAVLLFTRSAGQEAVHKPLGGPGRAGTHAAVAAQLIAHATRVARQAGADFLCVDSAAQVGTTFGERLSAALAAAFALGYEQLLVIGNDCPQLSPARLRQARQQLAGADAVLGPATDGGVYLLGITRAFFEPAAWADLPWQTPHLGRALRALLRRAGAVVALLPPLADVDNEQDLAAALRRGLPGPLARALRRLRARPRPQCRLRLAARRAAAVACPRRGPPAR